MTTPPMALVELLRKYGWGWEQHPAESSARWPIWFVNMKADQQSDASLYKHHMERQTTKTVNCQALKTWWPLQIPELREGVVLLLVSLSLISISRASALSLSRYLIDSPLTRWRRSTIRQNAIGNNQSWCDKMANKFHYDLTTRSQHIRRNPYRIKAWWSK